jgi:hypothetical protein
LGVAEVNYPVQDTDANGYFSIPVGGFPNGTYDWRVKGVPPAGPGSGPAFLARAGVVTLEGAPQTDVEMGQMQAADGNNDNVVNLLDFNIIKLVFGQPCGPCPDPRADFNGDGAVNISDFNLLKQNFGQAGDPALRPRP